MSSSRSVRFNDDAPTTRDAFAKARLDASMSVVDELVDKAVPPADYPGIVFRGGPTDSRAVLARGPDVSEVISALHDVTADDQTCAAGEDLVDELVQVTGLSGRQVRAAMHYYADFPSEVAARIAANRAAADREERLWRAEPSLL